MLDRDNIDNGNNVQVFSSWSPISMWFLAYVSTHNRRFLEKRGLGYYTKKYFTMMFCNLHFAVYYCLEIKIKRYLFELLKTSHF